MSKHVARLTSSPPSVAVVRELLQRVRDIGGDADAILRRAGFARGADAASPAAWECQLSREQFSAVYRDCVAMLEDYVSRRAGRPAMNKKEVDLLCYCLISCATLEQAIGRAAEFCMHTFHEKRDVSAFLSDLTGLSTYARLFGWLIGVDLEPLTVEACYRSLLDDAVVVWPFRRPDFYSAGCRRRCAVRISLPAVDSPLSAAAS